MVDAKSSRKKESLVDLANAAGFRNMHSFPALTGWIIGSVTTDEYEILYFRKNPDEVTGPVNPETKGKPVLDHGTLDIFAIVDPYDHDSCALYRLRQGNLLDANKRKASNPLNSAVCLDPKDRLYQGRQAVEVLKSYRDIIQAAEDEVI